MQANYRKNAKKFHFAKKNRKMLAYIIFFTYNDAHIYVCMLAKEKEIYKEKEMCFPHILNLSAYKHVCGIIAHLNALMRPQCK